MTVADFMATGTDTPLFFQAPFGLCRVIGVIARNPFPQIVCLTDNGQHMFIKVLWHTELLQHSDNDCPFDIADCPACQELYLQWYDQQQREEIRP